MPHQCTTCGRVFDDGSKEMLSGCPDCGGTTFQFHPSGADVPEEPAGASDPPDQPERPSSREESVARTVGNAAATVRDLVGSGPSDQSASSGSDSTVESSRADSIAESATDSPASPSRSDGPDPTSRDVPPGETAEDAAQASARSELVDPDELPSTEAGADSSAVDSTPAGPDAVAADDGDRPDLDDLRRELNEQFESIKVVEPGQYELNLMELYDREEYIIALQEDGKYCIQVPESWRE